MFIQEDILKFTWVWAFSRQYFRFLILYYNILYTEFLNINAYKIQLQSAS